MKTRTSDSSETELLPLTSEIRSQLTNPAQLEKLYRSDKTPFKRAFLTLYPEVKGQPLADFWKERFTQDHDEIQWGTRQELLFVFLASLVAGLIAKIPVFFQIDPDYFFPRNIGFVIFPVLTAYFGWKNKLSIQKIAFIGGAMLFALVFINLFPNSPQSDTLLLSSIHLLLFLWSILGFSFIGEFKNQEQKRLGYLKYNGDLVVMTTLILIAGGLMTAITIGLFSLIGFKIEEFYVEYVVTFGLPAAPILGTFLTQTNPQLVGKVSPVLAKIFSPLVLIMLVVYLVAIVYAGKDPYNDREFLLIFNALLIGVMAIIFFSIAETSKASNSRAEIWVLFLLSVVTIIVNGIALSAILFRISEGGITPNRAAVLGGNVLILIHLLLVTTQLYQVLFKEAGLSSVGKIMAKYLPIYCLWTLVVTFLFPFLFGFK
ncbi:hypothetical protein [Arundinibacter roseus]|uniref:DUF4153 domain-containing protein n=1 Tax=Arundinibacter roseus TaxID=2070510 RepID=A0A4R4KHG1_9BACT|nr:hypothetical protein [Arundinibacter roseus]TDB67560.1 hypothetical protein EZE20_06355 [Arundinibacter roseus]